MLIRSKIKISSRLTFLEGSPVEVNEQMPEVEEGWIAKAKQATVEMEAAEEVVAVEVEVEAERAVVVTKEARLTSRLKCQTSSHRYHPSKSIRRMLDENLSQQDRV